MQLGSFPKPSRLSQLAIKLVDWAQLDPSRWRFAGSIHIHQCQVGLLWQMQSGWIVICWEEEDGLLYMFGFMT